MLISEARAVAKRDNRVDAMRRNPSSVRFDDLCRLLEDHGFTMRPHSGGSHRVFRHPQLADNLSIPERRPAVRAVYVKKALRAIDAIEEE
ncbi:MAG: addiction module toxin, HicA family [Chloroflexi bacterium]|nr:addiction module toxin, HicA family [Chloroflexota bacterium]